MQVNKIELTKSGSSAKLISSEPNDAYSRVGDDWAEFCIASSKKNCANPRIETIMGPVLMPAGNQTK